MEVLRRQDNREVTALDRNKWEGGERTNTCTDPKIEARFSRYGILL